MVKNCYFVDTENVGRAFLTYLGACEEETNVYIFVGENCNRLKFSSNDLNLMFQSQAKLKMVDCKVGTANSMDFQISSQLGYCVHKYGKNVNYYILSKDKGYESLTWFWSQFGVTVSIVHDLSLLPGYLVVSALNFNYYVNQLNKNSKRKILSELNNRISYFSKKKEILNLDISVLDNYERYLVLKRVQENSGIDIPELSHILLPDKPNKSDKKEVKELCKGKEEKENNEVREKISFILEEDTEQKVSKDDLDCTNDTTNVEIIDKEVLITEDIKNDEVSLNIKPFTLFVGSIKAASLEKKLKSENILKKWEEDLISENQGVLRTVYNLDHSVSYVLGYTLYYCIDKKTLVKYIQRFADESTVEKLVVNDMQEIYHNIRNWDFMIED